MKNPSGPCRSCITSLSGCQDAIKNTTPHILVSTWWGARYHEDISGEVLLGMEWQSGNMISSVLPVSQARRNDIPAPQPLWNMSNKLFGMNLPFRLFGVDRVISFKKNLFPCTRNKVWWCEYSWNACVVCKVAPSQKIGSHDFPNSDGKLTHYWKS